MLGYQQFGLGDGKLGLEDWGSRLGARDTGWQWRVQTEDGGPKFDDGESILGDKAVMGSPLNQNVL